MTNLANSIRHTRFRVQQGGELTLTLQSSSGATYRLNVLNCSLMGLGASADIALSSDEGFYEGSILPPAKLSWGDKNAYLGRLVLRAIRTENNSYFYGFQTIDNKVPIDGPLSQVLAITDSAYEFELDPEKFSLASFLSSESSNVDLFARCRQFSFLYRKWKETPKYQYYTLRQPSKGPRVLLDMPRKHGRNDYLMLCSMEHGEEAQVWVNDSIMAEKNAMELAGKSIVQTASKKYAGRNILTEMDNGTVLEHEDGKPFTRVELTPSSLPVWQSLVERWQSQYDRSTAVTDALRGETPPSGQAFRLQAMVTNQSASQFDYRREEMGIFIREIFMDWILPHLIKKLKKGHTLVSDFSKEELDQIDEAYANSLIKSELEKAIKAGEIIDPMQVEQEKMRIIEKLSSTGSRRYIEVPDGFYDGIKVKIDIVTTGEQQNKQATLESMSNIFQTVAANPAILQDPVLSEVFYSMIETAGAGISPVTLSAKARMQPRQQMQQAQMGGGMQDPSTLPDPNMVGTEAQLSETNGQAQTIL